MRRIIDGVICDTWKAQKIAECRSKGANFVCSGRLGYDQPYEQTETIYRTKQKGKFFVVRERTDFVGESGDPVKRRTTDDDWDVISCGEAYEALKSGNYEIFVDLIFIDGNGKWFGSDGKPLK